MPSNKKSNWSTSSNSSLGVRLGAGIAVVAVHAIVAGAMLSTQEVVVLPPESQPIMVSVVEAPVPQVAKAPDTPEPPKPEVQPPTPPESQVQPDPDPTPPEKTEPEPEPEPEPVIEKPVAPAPKPKPKPKPKPQPVKQAPPPKPVEQPPAPPAPPSPPTGAPDGATTTQAPRQGPPRDQPETVSNIEYLGAGPAVVYPMASKRRREEGHVTVLVVVNPQGGIEKATVVASSGFPRLDDAALDAVRKVRFKPYTRNGVAYTVQARIPFDFNIRN